MSPSAKGTRQVSETSNKFNHDTRLNYVIAPHAPTGSAPSPEDGHDTTSDTQSTSTVDKHTGLRGFIETRKGKAIVTGTSILAIGGLAFGGFKIAEAASVPVSHEPVATAPANPGNTAEATTPATSEATPTATSTPEIAAPARYDYGITKADVAPLMNEDLNTLNNSPLQEKAKLALYYTQDLPAFAKEWQAVSDNPLDTLPAEINAQNTPDEINAVIMMSVRQAMTLTKEDGYHFDKAASDKLVTSLLINGSLSQSYKPLTDFSAQLDGPDQTAGPRALAASNYLSLPVINSHSDKYTDAAGNTCIDMNTTQRLSGSGDEVTGNITACLVTVDSHSTWMLR